MRILYSSDNYVRANPLVSDDICAIPKWNLIMNQLDRYPELKLSNDATTRPIQYVQATPNVNDDEHYPARSLVKEAPPTDEPQTEPVEDQPSSEPIRNSKPTEEGLRCEDVGEQELEELRLYVELYLYASWREIAVSVPDTGLRAPPRIEQPKKAYSARVSRDLEYPELKFETLFNEEKAQPQEHDPFDYLPLQSVVQRPSIDELALEKYVELHLYASSRNICVTVPQTGIHPILGQKQQQQQQSLAESTHEDKKISETRENPLNENGESDGFADPELELPDWETRKNRFRHGHNVPSTTH